MPVLVKTLRNHLEIIYIIMWVMLGTAHFFLIGTVYGMTRLNAFLDSLVFNMLYALIGAGLWFMVRYSNLKDRTAQGLVLSHLTSATATMAVWLGSGYFILSQLLSSDAAYQGFLRSTMTIRAVEGVMIYALLVTIYFLVINYRELKERSEREARLMALLKESELNLLRSQIRPHFLFNSLNSVSALTMSDPEKAREMVIKLSEFMRYSLNLSDSRMSTLENELYHAGLYLDIEKVRFGDKLAVERQIDPALGSWKVPAMILQPLLENAVKYGVYEASEPVVIKLSATQADRLLLVSIGNSYEPGAMIHKGTGTGLKNILARMQHLYNRGDLVNIQRKEDYFLIELKIPEDVSAVESSDH